MAQDLERDVRRMKTSDIIQLLITYTTLPPRTEEEAASRRRVQTYCYDELDARIPPRER